MGELKELDEEMDYFVSSYENVMEKDELSLDDEAVVKTFLLKEFSRLKALEETLNERENVCHNLEKELGRQEAKISQQTKMLKENEMFFEKKMQILKEGYFGLDEDRRRLEIERAAFETEKKKILGNHQTRRESYAEAFGQADLISDTLFFAGVNSMLALKKRYRDLMKIYHPDNSTGDEQTLLRIQREYENLMNVF